MSSQITPDPSDSKYSIITCALETCQKQHRIRTKEATRRKKDGHENFFCGFGCSLRFYGNPNSAGNPQNLRRGSTKDEYSPFREHLRRARNRGKDCNLTLQHLKDLWEQQVGMCSLTGIKLDFETHNPNYAASLDRIDSTVGYVIGNVQWVSQTINLAKSNSSTEVINEFLDIVRQV